MCGAMLARIDHADATIDELTERIEALLDPHEAAVTLLVTIPGVSQRTAQVILAEIGTDMSRFPTAGHLASWAGMCPGNNESAGKHRSGTHPSRRRSGSASRSVEAAPSRRTHQEHLPRRAIRPHPQHDADPDEPRSRSATPSWSSAWHLLSTGETYTDLGADYFERRRNSQPPVNDDSSLNSKRWATRSHSNPSPPDEPTVTDHRGSAPNRGYRPHTPARPSTHAAQ